MNCDLGDIFMCFGAFFKKILFNFIRFVCFYKSRCTAQIDFKIMTLCLALTS